MNRYHYFYAATLALLLAACAPGPEQTELEPVTPQAATPAAPTTEPPLAVMSGGAASGGAGVMSPDPQGEISISTDGTTFVTSGSGEVNPVSVPAGGTFYLKLGFTDPDGITAAQVELRNSDAAGQLPTGPFSIAANGCETAVATAPTDLSCTLTVAVAPDAQDISQPGETAYAFRPLVTDSLGNGSLAFSWAYLNVTPQ